MRCDTPRFQAVCSVGIESNHDYCKGEGHQLMSKFNSGISLSHTLYVLTVRSGIRETSARGPYLILPIEWQIQQSCQHDFIFRISR